MENVHKIAILGLGFMGGSLCLALKKNGFGGQIHVYARRRETVELALRTGMADAADVEVGPIVEGADVVVVCVPVQRIPALVRAAVPFLKVDAVITDVGSTKHWLHEQIDPILEGTHAVFVGSHPVAGSERTGAENASDSLYEKAVCILTSMCADRSSMTRVGDLWKLAGGVVLSMSPQDHDAMLARTSHLPHLVSSALTHAVARSDRVEVDQQFCGSGYRDMTRLAEGSSAMWRDIAVTNKDSIVSELQAMKRELEVIISHVEEDAGEELEAYLKQGQQLRFGTVE